MKRTLILRPGPGTAEWTVWAGQGPVEVRRGTLEQAAAEAAGSRIVVLVPGSEVVTARAVVPTRSRSRLRRAVPYALEDAFAEGVEALHFALGTRDAEDGVPVAVIARARMDHWLALLGAAGLRPDAVYAEPLALPWSEGEWTLLLDAAGTSLRTAEGGAYWVDSGALGEALALLFDEAEGRLPAVLRVIDSRREGSAPPFDPVPPSGVEVRREVAVSTLEVLARGLAQGPAIDLLQGRYNPREQLQAQWRPWLAAGVLIGLWLVLEAGLAAVRYQAMRGQEGELSTQIERVFRQALPEVRRVVDPRVQMERALAALRQTQGDGGLLPLLAAAAPVLGRTAGASLRAIRYREGRLELELSVPDLITLDGLKQGLGERHLEVKILAATSRNGRVESQLRVRGGKA